MNRWRAPRLMGVVNVTPDSFSDGGRYLDAESACNHIDQLLDDGVDILDLGAESTRPGAQPLAPEEEWERLLPILAYTQEKRRALEQAEGRQLILSLDTRHAETAALGLSLGVDWINDVNGLRDPAMLSAVRESDARLVVMHSLSIPADPAVTLPEEADPIALLCEWALNTRHRLTMAGIEDSRLIFDPGLGFGKNKEQSLILLQRMGELTALGGEWLVGHSRKSLFSLFTAAPAGERDVETLTASLWLAGAGVDYVRVHNIPVHRRAFRLAKELWGRA